MAHDLTPDEKLAMMEGEFFLGEFYPELHSEVELMEMFGDTILFEDKCILIYKDQNDHYFFRKKGQEDVSIEIILGEDDLTVTPATPIIPPSRSVVRANALITDKVAIGFNTGGHIFLHNFSNLKLNNFKLISNCPDDFCHRGSSIALQSG